MPYFYDTYAVLEYLAGNERFKPYFEDESGYLTYLNLMEIYYKILERVGEEEANLALSAISKFLREFDVRDVREAMKLRLKLKEEGRRLSYSNAMGYYMAVKLGIKFLTGDEAFKGLKNVEFLK
jgi:predicted nucleic acid-binding protein